MHYVKILDHPSTHGVAFYHNIFLDCFYVLRSIYDFPNLVNATTNKAPAKYYETGIVYRKGKGNESEKKQQKLIF